ncbi:threonine-phosphate decarboxylase [Thiohalorhabdus denitrificans]|uniref:threonine-phosphate decarboxylase n=1 Tax=Thiohalorhabdus denitrificans TaxID=381306 RepID=A0A0P9CJL7_9GAMM|nr:threonine-phosphate decarboxylase CobD [Thiohalorhabdus denitrificans]KPV39055.1 threonine-phosphate decarboxylase [Thiohalorhabdus denitrificans]SCX78839.1 L-threonine O-3-phosphate decarboxylase [Thiohalorhabdus denitrificans]
MIEHGGNLAAARARFGEPEGGWVDLSTGINSRGYPVPEVPEPAWHRLPEGDDGLLEAAAAYYGTPELLAVPGSEAAIQLLPRLRRAGRVAVLWPTYGEHAFRWAWAGHHVERVTAEELEAAAGRVDVLVVTNPNNPDGRRFAAEDLLAWHRRLAARGGWLIVDEAFADVAPEHSLAGTAGRAGLVVLRSPGKFFGLPGARVGFVAAEGAVREALAAELGPWPVAGPAREVVRRALEDRSWQEASRERLAANARRLGDLLERAGWASPGGTDLFRWVPGTEAAARHRLLAERGLWTRLFQEPAGLRIGLPGSEAGWARLEGVLAR